MITVVLLVIWRLRNQLDYIDSKEVSKFIYKKYTLGNFWCARYIAGVFIADFEQISHIFLVFPLLTLNKWILTGFAIA